MKLPLTILLIFFFVSPAFSQIPSAPTWKEDKIEFRFAKMTIRDNTKKKYPENFVDSKINITALTDNFWSMTVEVSNNLYIKDVFVKEYKYEKKEGAVFFTLTGVKGKEVIVISLYYTEFSDSPDRCFIGYSENDKAPVKTYILTELKD